MSRKLAATAGTLLVAILLLTSCAAEPGALGSNEPVSSKPVAPEASEVEAPDPAPITQEESCDWGTPRLASGAANAVPSAPGDDLETALIGAWQHTHFDTGSGFEAVDPTTDIRYVFPSTARILYCQDVPGATNQAENAAPIELNGAEIVLPAPATGYAVTAWSADTMVWTNHRDGSTYLLKRR